jgi:hypothetical protein
VDFPHPSDPSNVTNGSRGMISLVRSRCACKDVFQTPNSNIQAPKNLQIAITNHIGSE